MKLIIGLGNPGRKYEKTRHNLGQIVVKALAKELNCSFKKKLSFKSFVAEAKIKADVPIMLALPITFMNLSGQAVKAIKTKRNIRFSDVAIVCDDISLNFGIIRMRPGGSDGGHKGLRSIIKELGVDKFSRLRIGIKGAGAASRRREANRLSDYVLSSFNKTENMQLKGIISYAVECLKVWISEGINEAMNKFNRKNFDLIKS